MWRISFYGVNVKSTSYQVPMHLYICLRWGLFTICRYNWFVGIRLAECSGAIKSKCCVLSFCWCDLFRFDMYNCCFIFHSFLSFVSCCYLLLVYLLFVVFSSELSSVLIRSQLHNSCLMRYGAAACLCMSVSLFWSIFFFARTIPSLLSQLCS